MTTEQLAIPVPPPSPAPHPWQAGTTEARLYGVGACTVCGDGPLSEMHRTAPRPAAHRFFDALDQLDRDVLGVTRAVLRRGRDDLARLTRSDEHAADASFVAGVAWGHALAGLALSVDGTHTAGDARLSFVEMQRRATRRRPKAST